MKNTDNNKNQLLDDLARYGYELFVPATASTPEKVLEALLKQDDARLLEGFPVVLANAMSQNRVLEWEKSAWHPVKTFSAKLRDRLTVMLGLSALLFELFGMKEHCDRVSKLLRRLMGVKEEKKQADLLKDPFLSSEGLELVTEGSTVELSADRLKNSFRNYVVHQSGSGKELEAQKNALEYELRLSALFTARQKELLTKRLAGKPMTKTEKEYYSRVVKKRLNALADPRLHEMARALV